MKNELKVKQGKKNRKSGREFELKVRKDLELKGWTVAKWTNNIEDGKIISAKHKFNPFGRCMVQGTGFPDFIAFKNIILEIPGGASGLYDVMGVEVKSAKYLDKIEKEKCAMYLTNKTFSRILIASKCAEGIKYDEFVPSL